MSNADPILTLLNYGVLGLIVLLWLTGKLASGRELERARAASEADREALTAMSAKLIQDVVPALTRVTDATARATDALLARGANGG